jgi:hypothetical protein
MLCTGVAMVLYELAVFAWALIMAQTYLGRWSVVLIMSGLSTAAVSLLYRIFLAIGKIGGESWKE